MKKQAYLFALLLVSFLEISNVQAKSVRQTMSCFLRVIYYFMQSDIGKDYQGSQQGDEKYYQCLQDQNCYFYEVTPDSYASKCQNTSCYPSSAFLDQFIYGLNSCFEGNYEEFFSIQKKFQDSTYQGIKASNYYSQSGENPSWSSIKAKLQCYAICNDESFARCLTVTTYNYNYPIWEGFLKNLVDIFRENNLWNSGRTCRPDGVIGQYFSKKTFRNLAATEDQDQIYMEQSTDQKDIPGTGYDQVDNSKIADVMQSTGCSGCMPLRDDLSDSMKIIEFFWFFIALLVFIVEIYKFIYQQSVNPENDQASNVVKIEPNSQYPIDSNDSKIAKESQQAPQLQNSTINNLNDSNNGPVNQLDATTNPTLAETASTPATTISAPVPVTLTPAINIPAPVAVSAAPTQVTTSSVPVAIAQNTDIITYAPGVILSNPAIIVHAQDKPNSLPAPPPQVSSQPSKVQSSLQQPLTQNEQTDNDRIKMIMKKLTPSMDLMVNKHLVLFIIFIFLINNFKSHPYSAACIFLVLISLTMFNYIKIFEIYGKHDFQLYSESAYQVWIFSLYLLYFFNDTNAMAS